MASLKELLGDAYKEGMTLEEVEAALAERDLVDRSELGEVVSKAIFDKTASELSALKKEVKKLKESSMTAEEKATELQKQYGRELAKLKAKEIFIGAGLAEKTTLPCWMW